MKKLMFFILLFGIIGCGDITEKKPSYEISEVIFVANMGYMQGKLKNTGNCTMNDIIVYMSADYIDNYGNPLHYGAFGFVHKENLLEGEEAIFTVDMYVSDDKMQYVTYRVFFDY